MDYDELVEFIEAFEAFEMDKEAYDDLLDDCYEPCRIGNLEYSPSQVLRQCDPIAYDIGLGEEENYQREELTSTFNQELDSAQDSEEITQAQYDELKARFDAIIW